MGKPNYDPGPWRVDSSFDIPSVIAHCFPQGAKCVAVVYGDTAQIMARVIGSVEEAMPNARLIAAAPDLLAVLRDLEWIGMNDGRGVTQTQCPSCSALKSRGTGHNPFCGLAAALGKAKGAP